MKRPLTHVMEDTSMGLLKSLIPAEWIIRPILKDYGVDIEIELVDQGIVTGNRIWVQLKSVQSLDRSIMKLDRYGKEIEVPCVRFSLSTKELEYSLQCAFPLLLFVADIAAKDIYWLPLRDAIECRLSQRTPKWRLQKTNTLCIPLRAYLKNPIYWYTEV